MLSTFLKTGRARCQKPVHHQVVDRSQVKSPSCQTQLLLTVSEINEDDFISQVSFAYPSWGRFGK